MKQGKQKERKGGDWSFYFKTQPVLTALGQLELARTRAWEVIALGHHLISFSLLVTWCDSGEAGSGWGSERWYMPGIHFPGVRGAQLMWGPRPCPAKLNAASQTLHFTRSQLAWSCVGWSWRLPLSVGLGGNWLCVQRDTVWKYTWKVLLFLKIRFSIL